MGPSTSPPTLAAGGARHGAAISWEAMFMGVALLAGARSKDPKSQNGACIANRENRILGVGYNGLPRGCSDHDPVYWADDDNSPFMSKHLYVVHAEVNAILNCVVLPLTDARMYSTQYPCPRCTQAIIQSGITEIVYLREKTHHTELNRATEKMCNDAGVRLRRLEAMPSSWAEDLSGFLSSPDAKPSQRGDAAGTGT